MLDRAIDVAKVDYFRSVVLGLRGEEELKSERGIRDSIAKTITEIVIDNQMKIAADD